MAFMTGRSIRESFDTHMNFEASKNETLSRLSPIPAPIFHLGGETIPCTASHLSPCRRSPNSPINNEIPARQLPPELRFTPVNSNAENSKPIKPKRATNHFPSVASGRPARNCRLFGFTPLVEEDISSDDDSMKFLGPRKVQAKEVAPCALFYKRADVFVSSEMKNQNLLTFCESHYCKIRFDNEASVKELGYAHQHSITDHTNGVTEPPMKQKDLSHKKSSREDRLGLKINIKPSSVNEEPVCQTFANSGLTSMPLASDTEPGYQLDGGPLHIYTEETDSLFAGVSKAEHDIPWSTGYSYDVASDPEQSTSSISSSGIQSYLWDSVITSSTRAASPVSSIISSSCHQQQLTTSAIPNRFTQSHCKLTKFSLLKLNNEKESEQNFPSKGLFDWREDNGSMADNENDSDNSSIQLESDDD